MLFHHKLTALNHGDFQFHPWNQKLMNLMVEPGCKSLKNTKITRKRQGLTHLVQKLWNTSLENPPMAFLAAGIEEKWREI